MLEPNSGWDSQFGATAISLPTYSIAVQLLQNYESNVRPLCHILHMPTVRSQMRTFYLGIAQGESVLHGQAALLLSLFALSAYFYQPSDTSELATTKQEAIQISKILSGNALDVLDYSRRNTSGTLEDIQAYIHMAFVSYHLDGFSARGRMLTTIAIGIATELRLHQMDADPPNDETNIRCLVDREIQRRVFWHVTLTDWYARVSSSRSCCWLTFPRIFATISGPQEGTYSIHINHINVRLPKDCADDDLLLGTDNETTEFQPTGMSFFLSRLRLAHLSREMADTIPLSTSALMTIPYSQIVALDQKLQDLISSLPYFYRLDQESRRLTKPLETIYPKLSTQRYVLTTEHHSRRWKLHQRFLVRQSISPQHIYSRNACLESARAVIQGYADLKNCENSKGMAPELMGMVVHYTHLALVVMVMDLCFNRDENDEAEIKGEVKRALQMFEDGKEKSPLLARFLGSLKDVLGKHKVQLTDLPMVPIRTESSASLGNEMVLDGLDTNSMLDSLGMQDSGFVFDASFDEFWQAAMQGEMNSDQLTWDNLFSELDGQPI
jgi:hypothetical protein